MEKSNVRTTVTINFIAFVVILSFVYILKPQYVSIAGMLKDILDFKLLIIPYILMVGLFFITGIMLIYGALMVLKALVLRFFGSFSNWCYDKYCSRYFEYLEYIDDTYIGICIFYGLIILPILSLFLFPKFVAALILLLIITAIFI